VGLDAGQPGHWHRRDGGGGTLNQISASLNVSISVAGQLVAAAAAVMCLCAPLAAFVVGGWERRSLLSLTLLAYGAGHLLCTLAPSYTALLPIRGLTVIGVAVFTPQAAAAVGLMVPAERRAGAMTFSFLGWSVASVAGMPLSAWLGETFGWRTAFMAVAVLCLLAAGLVWRTVPPGLRPAPMNRAAWRQVFGNRLLMAVVAVTALQGAAQFALFTYMAPAYKLAVSADATMLAFLFAWFGVWGVVGNAWVSRHIDRLGPPQAAMMAMGLMAVSLLAMPLALHPGASVGLLAALLVPWGLGCFAANSAQQARLAAMAPALTPASVSLNTSAIYVGQAIGAAGGGWVLAHATMASPFGPPDTSGQTGTSYWLLATLGLGVMLLAMWVSRVATPRAALGQA
jgi:predicted MFS family arabinose efflux permease